MSKHAPENFNTERPLTAQRLAQYVARGRCERHMRYTLFPSEAKRQLARFRLEFEPLSPLLSGEGRRFEREMVERLASTGAEVRDMTNADAERFAAEVGRQQTGRVCYYQPTLRGRIGPWHCEGRADLIEVVRDGAHTQATVIDFKASARETVGFRLQVAFYARLLGETLSGAGFDNAHVRGAIVALLEYGERGMKAPAHKEEFARRVSARWPLAGRLPLLVQRARAAVRRLDRSVESRPYILGADFGSLPDPSVYPDLVRVFIDAQRDYIQDRLYLLAARVAGPRESVELVEMADAPPDTDAERELLVRFVQKLLPAVARAAGAGAAPLNFYTFAPRGERALLDALARHFDALCAVPAFYDLLTSSPALTQPMVSLLSEEVRARLNLAPVCQNLYETAAALGFQWSDGRTDFRRTFRARVFDNYRTLPLSSGEASVESAARFGAEIPLEYAYAAWGLLQKPDRDSQTRGFVGVSADEIRDFALARVRAMQHVEESFTYKNKKVEKEPLDLSRLGEVEADPSEVPLSRSLEDFLLLEHHASFQERLLHLSL
ncbi:MAG TPA: hypothetical protein VF521_16875, partial [Pyrinomonadaceae bacterium]